MASLGVLLMWLAVLSACQDDPPPESVAGTIELVTFTGLDGEEVAVNPIAVVSVREPRQYGRLVSPNARCIIIVGGGNFIAVLETCKQVEKRLEGKP